MAQDKKQDEEKKIIIDEDWKQQAEKEKEVLKAQEEAEKEQTEQTEGIGPLPQGDFPALVSMLVTQAMFAMGLLQVEGQQEAREPDLNMAKYNIDMLETLQEKCKGNLTEAEENLLANMLNQLRMAYVQVAGQ